MRANQSLLIKSMKGISPSYYCTGLQEKLLKPELVQLVVYEGAYRGFDRPRLKFMYLGHQLEYNPEAAENAKEKTKAFFDRHLFGK